MNGEKIEVIFSCDKREKWFISYLNIKLLKYLYIK